MNFDTLLYISNHPETLLKNISEKPVRTPEIQHLYDKDLKSFNKLYPSQKKDFIISQSAKLIFVSNSGKTFYLGLNPYPYNIERNIDHFIIWNFENKKITLEAIDFFVKKLQELYKERKIIGGFVLPLRDYTPTKFRFAWWENPDQLKTVKEIRHTHFFVQLN